MSNPWTQFLNLLPSTNRWVGQVANPTLSTGKITVNIPGSSTTGIIVNTDESYAIDDYVFIEGNTVVSKAPDLTGLYTEEITFL